MQSKDLHARHVAGVGKCGAEQHMQAKGRMCGCRTYRQGIVVEGMRISYFILPVGVRGYMQVDVGRWNTGREMQVQHIQESPRQAGDAHTGARWDLYFFLVLDQAADTLLGFRGLRIADPHSMLKGTTRCLDCLQVQVGCHIQATRHERAVCVVQVHMTLRVTDNHVILARVRDSNINIRHNHSPIRTSRMRLQSIQHKHKLKTVLKQIPLFYPLRSLVIKL